MTSHNDDLPSAPRSAPASASQSEIDGVPAFWGDESGPLTAMLMFRVGQADESLRRRGISRLVHRLARRTGPEPILADGGDVQRLITTFTVSGDDTDDVVKRFNLLVRRIVALPNEWLGHEVAAMLTDPPNDNAWLAELQTLRFGMRGYGLMTCEELGLYDVTASDVDDWQRRWFTAENAVVCFSHEPPSEISLSALPDGVRKLLPEPHPIEQPLPAWYPGTEGRLTASFLAPDNAESWLAAHLLQARLQSRLVATEAVASSASVEVVQLGGDQVLVHFMATVMPGQDQAVFAGTSAELFRFAMAGPSADELDMARAERRRVRLVRPSASFHDAQERALRDLFETPVHHGDDVSIELTPELVATTIRAMISTGIWVFPTSSPPTDQRLVPIPAGSSAQVEGNTFLPAPGIAAARQHDQLIVGNDGLTLILAGAAPMTVRFADCVAMQVWPDGARTLWGDDGIRFLIHYTAWQAGDQVLAWIDSEVDPWVSIIMANPSGYVLPVDLPGPGARR